MIFKNKIIIFHAIKVQSNKHKRGSFKARFGEFEAPLTWRRRHNLIYKCNTVNIDLID